MWLTQQFTSGTPARVNERGRVTMNEGSRLGVSAAMDERRVETYTPYGYAALPPAGERVLLLPCAQGTVCAGVLCEPGSLQPGEIQLCSAGGARIVLKNSGEIRLNGLTITAQGEIRGYRKEE